VQKKTIRTNQTQREGHKSDAFSPFPSLEQFLRTDFAPKVPRFRIPCLSIFVTAINTTAQIALGVYPRVFECH